MFSFSLFLSSPYFWVGFRKYCRGWLWISTGKFHFPGSTLRRRSLPQPAPSLGAYQLALLMIFSPPRTWSVLPLSTSPFLSMIRADEVLLFSVCTCNTRSTCHGMGAFSLSLSASFNFFWVCLFYIFSLVQVSERETLSFSGFLFSYTYSCCVWPLWFVCPVQSTNLGPNIKICLRFLILSSFWVNKCRKWMLA